MKFPTYEKMAKDVAEKALDEYVYQGKTLREWIQIILESQDEDCISRQAVLDMMQMRMSGKELYKAVYDLPPVTPQPKTDWIPVSERLPEKPNVYTVTDSKGDVVRFVFNDTESSREYWLRCAKAWMFIKPYIEDGETE